ncbi:MAG: DUF433 domain-containing protein [Methylococcaceae bacterium]|nr:DUF433 domain-containing protein [Methylococcaceae bacterium]
MGYFWKLRKLLSNKCCTAWLAEGMSSAEIIEDFSELNFNDISACLYFATDREL